MFKPAGNPTLSSSISTISGSDSVAPVGELKGLPGMTFKGLVGLGEVFLLLVWWELGASFFLIFFYFWCCYFLFGFFVVLSGVLFFLFFWGAIYIHI